jgi:hypothetical protein
LRPAPPRARSRDSPDRNMDTPGRSAPLRQGCPREVPQPSLRLDRLSRCCRDAANLGQRGIWPKNIERVDILVQVLEPVLRKGRADPLRRSPRPTCRPLSATLGPVRVVGSWSTKSRVAWLCWLGANHRPRGQAGTTARRRH